MSRVWFTSDTHYGHSNIASKSCSKWKEGYRDFSSLEEMNTTIIKNINRLVTEDDILYHLGDWSFGGIQNIWNFRKQLRVKTIHLILGNHCDHIRNNKVLPNCTYGASNIIHDGRSGLELFDILARNCFTSVDESKTVKHGHHTFYLSHYAHRVWYGHNKGVIHLYGHSHSSLENQPWGKSMDCGIDNAHKLLGEYRPFSIEEVVDLMDRRKIYFPDHHNAGTNIR